MLGQSMTCAFDRKMEQREESSELFYAKYIIRTIDKITYG